MPTSRCNNCPGLSERTLRALVTLSHALRGPCPAKRRHIVAYSAVSSVRVIWATKKRKLGNRICTNASTDGSKWHLGQRPRNEPTQREELQHHLAKAG